MTDKKITKAPAMDYAVIDPIATVLVVEDQPIATRIARQLLQEHQCASDEAVTGKEALEKTKNKEYDLILMDIGLPDIDGFELTRKIRKKVDAKQTPIVAVTGHVSSEQRQACFDVGMQAIISKPLDVTGLKKALGTYVFPPLDLEDSDQPFLSFKPETAVNQNVTLDFEEGMRLAGGKLENAKEMIQLLVKSLPEEIAEIREAVATKDAEQLHDLVHRMYGGLCYCGTPKLRRLVRELKESLIAQDLSNLDDQFEQIAVEARAVISEFKIA